MSQKKCTHFKHFITEKISRARRVQISQHDGRTVKVVYTILVLVNAHDCVPQMCGNAVRVFENQMDIVQVTKGAQVKVQRNGER